MGVLTIIHLKEIHQTVQGYGDEYSKTDTQNKDPTTHAHTPTCPHT